MNASAKSLFRPGDAARAWDPPGRPARGGGRRARLLAAAAVGLGTAAGLALLPSAALAAPAASPGAVPAGARDAATTNPADQLLAVSCPARRMCVAVGIADITTQLLLAERWNGRSWTVTHPVLPAQGTSGGLTGVSCSSSRACTAVGFDYVPGTGGGPLAERWNGRSWTLQSMPSAGNEGIPLAGVSCPTARSCTAVGAANYDPVTGAVSPLAEHWNGSRWAIQPAPQIGKPGSQLSGVSCSSPSACTAVGDYEGKDDEGPGTAPLALRWNGVKWAVQPTPGGSSATDNEDSQLAGVSCTAASACIAVGYDPNGLPLALRWNGRRWASQQITGPLPLSAVSCWSAGRCIAVGDADFGGFAERLQGRTWAPQQVPTPAGANGIFLTAVSCSAPSRCTAVGYQTRTVSMVADIRTLAERWNGRSWVVQATPSPLR
jgi:hypothetical protein